MSQRRDTMNAIDRDSGLKGLIVRPLSAQYLKPTIPEIQGIVDRNQLLNIRGRSRKTQMALAEEKGIYDYPCASGGCLLTDHHFANRLKDLYQFQNPVSLNDAKLLRVGRHLRINDQCKIIVGRNKEENEKLEKLVEPGDYLFKSIEYKGPLVVARGKIENGAMETISAITAYYSKAPNATETPIEVCKSPDDQLPSQTVSSLDEETVKALVL
jgi:tRNA U34 2-thiouridine synthase MnmA/TrmU